MLLCDWQIRALCVGTEDPKMAHLVDKSYLPIGPMLEPFSEGVCEGMSRGLTSAGYDLTLARGVLVFKNTFGEVVNPRRFKDPEYLARMFDRNDEPEVILPPHGYCLAMSEEWIRVPRKVKGRCVGKSTYARGGVIVNTTPLEPGWQGRLTIEIGNLSPCPLILFVGEGIAQLEFDCLDGVPEKDYSTKNDGKAGKYMNQTEVTPPRVL